VGLSVPFVRIRGGRKVGLGKRNRVDLNNYTPWVLRGEVAKLTVVGTFERGTGEKRGAISTSESCHIA